MKKTLNSYEMILDFQNVDQGEYILVIYDGNLRSTHKIVKE